MCYIYFVDMTPFLFLSMLFGLMIAFLSDVFWVI